MISFKIGCKELRGHKKIGFVELKERSLRPFGVKSIFQGLFLLETV